MAKKILIIDDNNDILDIVQETLTYENFEVLAKNDTANFMEAIGEFSPDLLILDHRLGNITGGEICQQVKGNPQYSNLPVIIFSAYINKKEDLFKYGCDAIIDKPFDLTELTDKVNGLLYQETAQS